LQTGARILRFIVMKNDNGNHGKSRTKLIALPAVWQHKAVSTAFKVLCGVSQQHFILCYLAQ
jgi:hypothetical protein